MTDAVVRIHTEFVWTRLMPFYEYWQSLLPFGGPIPKEAEPFFSPGFLWTRLPLGNESDRLISKVIRPAFGEYLSLYIDLIKNSNYQSMATHQEGVDVSTDSKERVDFPAKERILELYKDGLSNQQIIERGFSKKQVQEINAQKT